MSAGSSRLSHAWRRSLLDGPQRPHLARQVSRRTGGHAFLYRRAGSCRLQVDVDPRAKSREIRPAGRVLDPDLHRCRDWLPARHLRWQLSHGDAHRRGRRRLGEMDGAQELQAARYRRGGPCARGHARHRQRDLRMGGGVGVEPNSRPSTILLRRSNRNARISSSAPRPTSPTS